MKGGLQYVALVTGFNSVVSLTEPVPTRRGEYPAEWRGGGVLQQDVLGPTSGARIVGWPLRAYSGGSSAGLVFVAEVIGIEC